MPLLHRLIPLIAHVQIKPRVLKLHCISLTARQQRVKVKRKEERIDMIEGIAEAQWEKMKLISFVRSLKIKTRAMLRDTKFLNPELSSQHRCVLLGVVLATFCILVCELCSWTSNLMGQCSPDTLQEACFYRLLLFSPCPMIFLASAWDCTSETYFDVQNFDVNLTWRFGWHTHASEPAGRE